MLESCNADVLSNKELTQMYGQYNFNTNRYEESQLYKKTGCMPGCSKRKFEVKEKKLRSYVNNGHAGHGMELVIRLQIPNGEYELTEEYYLYDFDSFIPDVGGYLGLLLGYSMLSLYHTLTQWLTVAKQWLHNSNGV